MEIDELPDPGASVTTNYQPILQLMVECSERVRRSVISANHATMSESVGMGADGESTSRIDQIAEQAALHCFDTAEITGNVLSEEIGFVDRGAAITFILDPIDSTSNATVAIPAIDDVATPSGSNLHTSQMVGFPYFAFSVAAMIDNQLVAACVRNLPTGDLFTAIRGEGAAFNGARISTTRITSLDRAWVALIRPNGDEGLRRVSRILTGAKRVRITGCSALDLVLIASGGLHGLVNPNAHRPPQSGEKVVDYAGAQLILQEAGGRISDTEGNPLPIDHDVARLTPVLAAGTPELHTELIRAIHPS